MRKVIILPACNVLTRTSVVSSGSGGSGGSITMSISVSSYCGVDFFSLILG